MSNELRVAVIGRTGRGDYGHGLDTVWKEVPGTQVVAVADDDPMGLAAAAKRLGVDKAYRDYRQMLDAVRPHLVAIAPRWIDQHSEMVIAAAEHGAHIYMEKPFCRSPAEADAMVAACERSHVKLALATQTRYSPKLPVIQQMIADGKLGTLIELRGHGKEDQRGGSEDLWVLGTHILDLMRFFGGEPTWCQASVTQQGQPLAADQIREGAEGIGPLGGDQVQAMFGLAGGATGYFGSKRLAQGKPSRFGLMIYGTEGVLDLQTGYLPAVKFLPASSWSAGRGGQAWLEVSSQGVGQPETLSDGGLHQGNILAAQDLIASIKEDRQPKASMYDGRMIVEMISAVFESERTQRRVAIPLVEREAPLSRWR
jgi:predicted dehydrogenase